MTGAPPGVVVMGVSGCGKSVVGRHLARELGAEFEDADDFHPPSNKAKMSAGKPLADEDRRPWYRILRARIVEHRRAGRRYVLACSALKEVYREWLRGGDPPAELVFVYLRGSRDLIGERLAARKGHFMPASLLESQFAALEEPRDAVVVDIAAAPEEIAAELMRRFRQDISS